MFQTAWIYYMIKTELSRHVLKKLSGFRIFLFLCFLFPVFGLSKIEFCLSGQSSAPQFLFQDLFHKNVKNCKDRHAQQGGKNEWKNEGEEKGENSVKYGNRIKEGDRKRWWLGVKWVWVLLLIVGCKTMTCCWFKWFDWHHELQNDDLGLLIIWNH